MAQVLPFSQKVQDNKVSRADEGNRMASLILAVMSMWPLPLLYAIVDNEWNFNYGSLSPGLSAVTVLMIILANRVLHHSKRAQPVEYEFKASWIPKDDQVTGFILGYALPFLLPVEELWTPKSGAYFALLALLVFFVWRCNIYQLNPAILINGYRVFEVETSEGVNYWILAKGPRAHDDLTKAVRITPVLLLEVG